MADAPFRLKEVDRLEVLTIMDNYADLLLPNTDHVSRPLKTKGDHVLTDTLVAEHGLCLLIRVKVGETLHTILFDSGYSPVGVPHNMDLLEVDLEEIEAMVLSHGHMDHTGALEQILIRRKRSLPLVAHPMAFWTPRYKETEEGNRLQFPVLSRDRLQQQGAEILERRFPTLLAEGTVLVTGEVERTTDFEKGLPGAFLKRNGKVEKDQIMDDQALVVHLRGKGLALICGCSHAGVINTLLYAQKLSGVSEIYALLGGFHLSGSAFEAITEETVRRLEQNNPGLIVPMHCTGWKATQRLAKVFPSAFALSSVGSKVVLP